MLGYRNPSTRRLLIPFAMYKSPAAAVAAVKDAALARDWPRTTNIAPVDGRVLWTIEDDHIALYYRTLSTGGPITQGG